VARDAHQGGRPPFGFRPGGPLREGRSGFGPWGQAGNGDGNPCALALARASLARGKLRVVLHAPQREGPMRAGPRTACIVHGAADMHEIAVCTELLGHLAVLASPHRPALARRVVLEIGPLSEVDPTLLIEAFSILRAQTVADRATLAVEALPLRMRCGECGCEPGPPQGCACPECGQDRSVLMNGDGLELRLVEFGEAQRRGASAC